jgi:hypothetical protein
MGMTVHRFDDVEAFMALAGPFLLEREAEHNLLLGIVGQLASPGTTMERGSTCLAVTGDDRTVVGAALHAPPYNPVLSQVDDLEAVDALVDSLRADRPPGLLGPSAAAARFVERWRTSTGQRAELEMAQRAFRLDRVLPLARRAPGAWRFAEERDQPLLSRWMRDFQEEALPAGSHLEEVEPLVDRWIRRIGRTLYLWEDGDGPVSVVGVGGATPNSIRVGPVYTPRQHRGRGYATALTASASQDQLDRGRRFCTLFTDLANPTSNRIYRAIGYEPVYDMDQYRFHPA